MKNCIIILLVLTISLEINTMVFKKTIDNEPELKNIKKRKLGSDEGKEGEVEQVEAGKDDKKVEYLKKIYQLIIDNKGEAEIVEDEAYTGDEKGSSFTISASPLLSIISW